MKRLEKLKDTLMRELDEIAEKGTISAGDLESVFKLVMAIKGIYKIERYTEEYGHSNNGGMWKAEGGYSTHEIPHYDEGISYSSRRRRDAMGRYSRNEYSTTMAKHELASNIRDVMGMSEMSNTDREILNKALSVLSK